MRKRIGIFCMAAVLVLGSGCGTESTDTGSEAGTEISSEQESDYSNTTVTGKITAMSGNEVTLQLGELTESEAPDGAPDSENQNGEGQNGGAPSGEAPEKPAGESQNGGAPSGEAPEKPDGENQNGGASNGNAPEMPEGGQMPARYEFTGNGETITLDLSEGEFTEDSVKSTLDDLSEGDILVITTGDNNSVKTITVKQADGSMGNGGPDGMDGAPGGESQGVDSYSAVTEYTEDTTVSDTSFTSTGSDENAVLVSNGATAELTNVTIDRTSSDSTGGNDASFYGVGAAALVTDGTLKISDSTITTDSNGGAGVFAYGNGVAYVSDTKITTQKGTSGGIHVAGGGTLYAENLEVETNGESSAAIRSDRGGGIMEVDGGTYTSKGTGSPAIYSTADITVSNATLSAENSEAVCIEGLNSIHLTNCDLTGNMPDQDQNDCTWNVILYQSMSGDSEVGNSTFEMEGGSLTAKNGGMFYTTNTESTFVLSGVTITNAENSEFLLRCTGNSNQRGWGESGKNGADCSFTAKDQELNGDVIWDSISQLDFYLTEGSTLTGAFIDDESDAGNGGDGYASLSIDEDSTWIVTGDSVLTTLHCAGKITDSNGKQVTIQGSDGSVYVKGDSSYTITVENYEDTL